ncbi:MAG: Uma2 family endonuclease [Cyanobacteria bacterium P01_F01_bin.153]
MPVTFLLAQLDLQPGDRLKLRAVDWRNFEEILAELGDTRNSRITYQTDILEIEKPTPEHEVDKELISDIVKILLDELEIDCECFGSTTFKRPDTRSGLEPDQCFYIKNHAQMRGKRRLDLERDPPPDLAIEIDVTSKTRLDAYEQIGVRELWIYDRDRLTIYVLSPHDSRYTEVSQSPTFPNLQIAPLIETALRNSRTIGRSPTLRQVRQQVRGILG